MPNYGQVEIVFDSAAIRAWADEGIQPLAALDRAAALVTQNMKRLCPVSPTQAVYAYPVPLGCSTGPPHAGRPIARPSGAAVSRLRYQGDLPLRPSGYLRNSIQAFREAPGSVIIGPTAPYGRYVNDGTPPHGIDSTGPWPLRNRATGQVFGRHVNHPGTRATHFVERSVEILSGVVIRV